ncbi:MAG: hypothetical protein GEU80_09205 [Dehalococcoidia bacterium]|nr:hypothetical protein [Dehalococcoidia bacterium]
MTDRDVLKVAREAAVDRLAAALADVAAVAPSTPDPPVWTRPNVDEPFAFETYVLDALGLIAETVAAEAAV